MSDNGPRPVNPQIPSEQSALPAVTNETIGAIGNPMSAAPWMDTKESSEGFNFAGFLHSLRRRWLAGVGFGCIAAAFVALLLYMMLPVKYEAFVTLRVRRNPDEILRQNRRMAAHPADFEIEKQTQAALLKSPFVINAALRQTGISQMPLVRDEAWPWLFGIRENPVAWLTKELKVQYQEGSEILRLSMHEKNPDELKKLLNAVTSAYMEEIVDGEAAERMVKLQKLRDRYRELMNDMNDSLKKISELAKTYGSTESESVKLQIDLGLKQLAALDRERMSVDQQYFEAYDMLMLQQQRINSQMSYDPRPFEIEDVLQSQYPDYAMLKTQKIELEHMIQSRSGGRAGAGAMQPQLAAIQSQMDQIRYDKKDEVTERLRLMSGNDSRVLQEDLQVLQLKVRSLLQRRNKVYSDYQGLSNQLKSMGAYNADLDGEKMAIQAQQEFVSDVKKEMETLELEVASKPQIRVLQEAIIPDENNLVMKYFQVIAASMLTMFVTILGVAFWDMQSKRVNSSQELSDAGDLRVIGSLPQINGRRAGGLLPMSESSKQRIELGLTRSIDSIRTAILFAKTSRPYQVIMVTSALGQEGKTTVASQLAVSFARSGKRTLLIDADVRNPQQHVVLGMPFQRGLCDLLRSNATIDEVIQPTPAESLWLLGAGQRDVNTDQLLGAALPTIIQELRSQFDLIIIDTGPVLTCPDAMLIGQSVDTALVSIMRDVSRIPKVTDACHRLRSVGIPTAGAVLNGDVMDIRASDLQMTSGATNDPQLEKNPSS